MGMSRDIKTNLVEILLAVLPRPILATKLDPVVKGPLTTSNPSIVVSSTATTEHLTTGNGLFNASVVGSIDHGSLETPVVLAATKFESLGWSRDGVDFASVAVISSVNIIFLVWVLGLVKLTLDQPR